MQFECEVRQVKSMADYTWNLVLNLPEYQLAEAQQLMAMIGEMVQCNINAITTGKQYDAISEGTKRKSKRKT